MITPVPPFAGTTSVGCAGGWLKLRLNGAPGVIQVYPAPVIVPLTVVPAVPFTAVPEPSFNPQRATRPVWGVVSWALAVPWISAWVRA